MGNYVYVLELVLCSFGVVNRVLCVKKHGWILFKHFS